MALTLCGLPAIIHKSSLIMRKTWDNSQLRHILQNTWLVPFKTVQGNQKLVKIWEMVTAQKSLRELDGQMSCEILNGILEYKTNTLGKTKEIWIVYEL